MLDLETARRRLAAHHQEHVLRYWDRLDEEERRELLRQLEAVDLDWLERVMGEGGVPAVDPAEVSPYREVIREDDPDGELAWRRGEQALREGKVSVLLVAGGQGTRLGFDGPKGAFPVGAVSGRTLYQIHIERLLALGRRYGVIPPLYLMTSDGNHQDTLELLAHQRNYGLPESELSVFPQGVAPAVDEEGKLLLEAPGRLVLAPNGNGGLFAALAQSGALADMQRRGVEVVSYIQVDNPLSSSGDPRFVGYHLLRGSAYSCKAIRKLSPGERVGAYARVCGRLRVVEYTEIPAALAEKTDERGELYFLFANPGLFLWSRRFLEEQARRRDLPFHLAHKKIPHLDEHGRLVEPSAPCGYKLEAFAMDTLPDAQASLVLACDRDSEFAPVKNASGADSPESARSLMTRLYASWVERAGRRVELPEGAHLEVSPLFALDAGELASKLPPGRVFREPTYLR
jgi:UDP-N-acetylglucosamine/UDP-N-acetylgalactosamine diphosphorylase